MKQTSTPERYIVPSLDRAVDVLEWLAREPDGLSLGALTQKTGIPKSTLFRILVTLQRRQCVVYDDDRSRYSLGLKLWELGSAFINQSDLYRTADAYMKQLAEACGESVFLGVLDEAEVIYVRRMESPRSVAVVRKLGQRVPAYCTATGEAMLAFLAPEQVDRLLAREPLQTFNAKTVTDYDALQERLARIRQERVAVVDGEYNAELLCIASPVLDDRNRPCAALTVAMLSSQANEARIEETCVRVRQAAHRLSRDLGYVEAAT